MALVPNMMMIVVIGQWADGLLGYCHSGRVFRANGDPRLHRCESMQKPGEVDLENIASGTCAINGVAICGATETWL